MISLGKLFKYYISIFDKMGSEGKLLYLHREGVKNKWWVPGFRGGYRPFLLFLWGASPLLVFLGWWDQFQNFKGIKIFS